MGNIREDKTLREGGHTIQEGVQCESRLSEKADTPSKEECTLRVKTLEKADNDSPDP